MRSRFFSRLSSPFLSLVLRWCLGSLFLFAWYTKAIDPDGFAQAIYNYRLLPGWLVNPMAIILPWVELMVGLGLLLGIQIAGAALLATGLLAIFASALGISLARGLDISCGCFNQSSSMAPITWLHLLGDFALMGIAIQVFLFDQGMASLGRCFRKDAAA